MDRQSPGDVARSSGNVKDDVYGRVLANMQVRFTNNVEGGAASLFETDADDLWLTYLYSFPPETRQFHACSACRRFVERFGGLVTIDEDGATRSAMWDASDAEGPYSAGFLALADKTARAKVTGVFLSRDATWGRPVTGEWTHLAVTPPKTMLYAGIAKTPRQAMAEKGEDYKNVLRALAEFSTSILDEALRVLKADALYRSEKVIGPAKWLRDLYRAAEGANRSNVVWRAVATAPPGFAHPRSSMIGTLLEDIEKGLSFDEVARRFAAKMHPLQYMRPQAAPSAGNIAQAEKLIASLSAAGSLARRFARVEEIDALWRPPLAVSVERKATGVFGHLMPKDATAALSLVVPPQTVTWEKFARTALPKAVAIEALVPSRGDFAALLTAENADAPPILQWDAHDRRNPFSIYVYHAGSSARDWGLRGGAWAKVTAVCLNPSQWYGGNFPHHGKGALFVIEGSRDQRNCGNALFPETLKSEFHGIRATIEAYSRSAKLAGREEASACGLMFQGAHVRVTDVDGATIEYRLDRLD